MIISTSIHADNLLSHHIVYFGWKLYSRWKWQDWLRICMDWGKGGGVDGRRVEFARNLGGRLEGRKVKFAKN